MFNKFETGWIQIGPLMEKTNIHCKLSKVLNSRVNIINILKNNTIYFYCKTRLFFPLYIVSTPMIEGYGYFFGLNLNALKVCFLWNH